MMAGSGVAIQEGGRHLAEIVERRQAISSVIQAVGVRDEANRMKVIALAMGFKKEAVAFSAEAQRCERVIHKLNPAKTSGPGRGIKPVPLEHGFLKPDTIRKIRAVHSKYDDVEFELAVAAQMQKGKMVTRESLKRRAAPQAHVEAPPLPEGAYDVIVIDPPWPMKPIRIGDASDFPDIGYPTMDLGEIGALQVPAENTHVFLWTTQRFLPAAMQCLKGWNARYVCTYVWRKTDGPKPPGLPKYNVEFVLYGKVGKPHPPRTEKDWWVCFDAPRGKHSEKPEAFYAMVRRVYGGRRLDMFSRREIEGFEGWGNEA